MAAITAAMVKALRQKTDAPMMECKKAPARRLTAIPAKAEEILRVKLGNKASKAAARVTAEGVVAVYLTADRQGRRHPRSQLRDRLRCQEPRVPADGPGRRPPRGRAEPGRRRRSRRLSSSAARPSKKSAPALVGKIGENMTFRRFQRFEAKGTLHKYIHGGAKIAALVDMVGGDDELAHDIAMHVAASKPKALDKTGVDQELIETERRVAIEKAREAGKPEAMLERIAEGSVQKFLKSVTLLDQPFVKDDKVTVGQLLKSKGASVAAFGLYVVGEGLEKRNEDFAAEVAAQQAAAAKA